MRAFQAFLKQFADLLRDDGQNRSSQSAFYIINSLDARIEVFDEEGETNTHDQTDDDAQGKIERFVRADRVDAGFGDVNNADGVIGLHHLNGFNKHAFLYLLRHLVKALHLSLQADIRTILFRALAAFFRGGPYLLLQILHVRKFRINPLLQPPDKTRHFFVHLTLHQFKRVL